jgi:D-hydroxyproline dehydrogenase subunit beta
MSGERDAVIGAGIVGLALARALARRGRMVTVFETDATPQAASVRNFGTLWPVGQPAGPRRTMALESLAIWRNVLTGAQAWSAPHGSLHLAYHDDELAVLTEFAASATTDGFACELLDPEHTRERSAHVRSQGLLGALWSPHEVQVNPRQVMERVPLWLSEQWPVQFERATRVTSCSGGVVRAGDRAWEVDRVWLATGADLQTLYPEAFRALGLRRCKLQMMRTAPLAWSLGPVLAGGLTLGHYQCFGQCPSLPALKARLAHEWPAHTAFGVHVLVSQHDQGQLVLGDSHEYDDAITPFDKPAIDELVLEYLRTFLDVSAFRIVERWHGVYVKHPDAPYCIFSPEAGVTAVAALGGHGMTLSFGLAEQVVTELLDEHRLGVSS